MQQRVTTCRWILKSSRLHDNNNRKITFFLLLLCSCFSKYYWYQEIFPIKAFHCKLKLISSGTNFEFFALLPLSLVHNIYQCFFTIDCFSIGFCEQQRIQWNKKKIKRWRTKYQSIGHCKICCMTTNKVTINIWNSFLCLLYILYSSTFFFVFNQYFLSIYAMESA